MGLVRASPMLTQSVHNVTLRQYTIILAIGTLIIWFTWFLVINNIDPINAGSFGFLIFYITLFGGLVGTLTTLSTLVRSWRHPHRDIEDVIVVSVRQAIILALLLIGCLMLASVSLLNWPFIIGLLFAVGLFEAIFILRKKPVKSEN